MLTGPVDSETDPERGGTWNAPLVSGEAVEIDIRFARIGSRALALLIDIAVEIVVFIVLAVVAGLVLAAAHLGGLYDDALGQATWVILLVLVVAGYPIVLETATRGRTFGKMALGLRVVRTDGGPIAFRHALARALVGVAIEWPGLTMPFLTWTAAMTTMVVDPRGRRLGDLAAGTMVIHDRDPASWGWVPLMPPPLAGWARSLDLTGLDDDLALAVRHYLARNRQLVEPSRSQLGISLAKEVAAATTPSPPLGTPGWMYLAAVVSERHRRATIRLVAARSTAAAMWPGILALSDQVSGVLPPTWLPQGAVMLPPGPWSSPDHGHQLRPAAPSGEPGR